MLPAVGAALLAASALAGAARAAQPLGPGQIVVDPGCQFDFADGDAEAGSDGLTRGFVQFVGDDATDCQSSPIYFFQQRPDGGWQSEPSPYTGSVLGAAQDRTGTYLLYAQVDQELHIRIAKRTAAGVFTPGRTLQTCTDCGLGGDVIAEDGRWLAVWDTRTGLAQAKTIGADGFTGVTSIDAPDNATGAGESLRLAGKPDGAVLIWTGYGERTELWITTTQGDDWRSRRLRGDNRHNYYANDATVSGGRTYITYGHSRNSGEPGPGRMSIADNQDSDALNHHTFRTGGDGSRVAVSNQHKFVTWATEQGVLFTEWDPVRQAWVDTYLTRADQGHRPFAITAHNGKATVLVSSPTALYARTQQ